MPDRSLQTIDIPETDLWSLLFERNDRQFSDGQPIYTSPKGRCYTYGEVKLTAQRFGAGLRSRYSWQKGDVLAIFAPNCIDTPAVTLGCHWAGGVVSPANPAYTVDELSFHLRDSGAKLLVTQAALVGIASQAARAVGLSRERIILIGDDVEASSGYSTLGSALSSRPTGERTHLQPKSDLAFLVYSSGTTGHPKGVMLSHLNVVSDLSMLASVEGAALASGKDKILSVLPYYHIYGLTCLVLQPLFYGVESVVMAAFDLKTFCQIVQDHKITYAYVAPPVVLHLAKSPIVDDYDLRTLRMLTSGAAPLTKDLILTVKRRLGFPVKQAYGLSETSPVTHMMPWDDTWLTAIGSNGPPLPNLTTQFMSPEGRPCGPNQEGELWISGPTVFQGYHNNEAATKACMTPDHFFKTGDIGYEDAAGNMYITDRVKELIKYKGSQVAPAELEGLLVAHPSVEDAAVVGYHVKAIETEVPLAFIVAKEGVARDEAAAVDIIEWLAQKTAKTKRLRGGIVWVETIPKSPSGKILRRVLKETTLKADFNGAVAAVVYDDIPRSKL